MNDFNEPIVGVTENFSKQSKEHTNEQDNFNKRFLMKLMLFMFLYRFYSMHIDKKGTLIGYVDEIFQPESDNQPNYQPNYQSVDSCQIDLEDLQIEEVD
jgi:hypothetical protein